jgi:diadenosine tetraphosphate (Ap4A) HIT family hydrolase
VNDFILHARLEADTAFVCDWPLCRVLLMNDARFPWLILVPRVGGVEEVFDLGSKARASLIEEIARAGTALKQWADARKINVGTLGNMVPQLHIHVVARTPGDAAWPDPVWGTGTPEPYDDLTERVERLRRAL